MCCDLTTRETLQSTAFSLIENTPSNCLYGLMYVDYLFLCIQVIESPFVKALQKLLYGKIEQI